jgi:hypothetical protein
LNVPRRIKNGHECEKMHLWEPRSTSPNNVQSLDYSKVRKSCQLSNGGPAPKADTDHIAGISRERIYRRKRIPYEESRDKSRKAKICISLRREREKALYPRIKPNRKGGITQDPQDKPNRIRDQKIPNDGSIHKNRPEHDRARLHDTDNPHNWRAKNR